MGRGARASRAAALACALACACSEVPAGSDAGSDAGPRTDAAAAADACACDDAGPEPLAPDDYARWPIPALPSEARPPEQRYDAAGALVTDAITGLVWQRGEAGDLRDHDAARAYCGALVEEGRDDFRLPTRIEWVSVLDPTRSPAIDPVAFPVAIPEYHWTSSLGGGAPGSAYSVYLGAGETTLGLASRPSARVRCVAGGPPPLAGAHFEIVGADRARDRGTGLVWDRAPIAASTWDEAGAACASSGARLPSIRELQSIVLGRERDPAIDRSVFADTPSSRHWTSTVRDTGELSPWTVDFLDGQTFADEPATARHVARCVR